MPHKNRKWKISDSTSSAEPKPIFIGHRKCSSAKNSALLSRVTIFTPSYTRNKILSSSKPLWGCKSAKEHDLATFKIDRLSTSLWNSQSAFLNLWPGFRVFVCVFHDSCGMAKPSQHDGRSRDSIYVAT